MSSETVSRALPVDLVALAVAVGAVIGYTLAVGPVIRSPAQLVYPLVWLAASAIAVWTVRDQLRRLGPVALTGGLAYTLVLCWTAGLLAPGTGTGEVAVHFALPGWGPAVFYSGSVVTVLVVPFLVVGYVTLGLLGAGALRVTLQSVPAGAVGLLACVSCTAPLLAGLAGSLGAGSLASAVSTAQYPLATAAFLLSAAGLTLLVRRKTPSSGTETPAA